MTENDAGSRDVVRPETVQQRRQQARCARGCREPEAEADDRQAQPSPRERLQDLAGCRTERHAHADLVRALRDRIGEHPIDAE